MARYNKPVNPTYISKRAMPVKYTSSQQAKYWKKKYFDLLKKLDRLARNG